MTAAKDTGRLNELIAKWKTYRATLPEPDRYRQIGSDLYKVRNPSWRGNPPLSAWPPNLIDSDDSMMAAAEHNFPVPGMGRLGFPTVFGRRSGKQIWNFLIGLTQSARQEFQNCRPATRSGK